MSRSQVVPIDHRGIGRHEIQEIYLEEVVTELSDRRDSSARRVLTWLQELPPADVRAHKVPGGSQLDDWLELMADYVWRVHLTRPPCEAVLVFLPTYMLLEAVHAALLQRQLTWPGGREAPVMRVSVLHSSVDLSEAMAAVRGGGGAAADGSRTVLLASNVAESSLTIPDLAHVVDSCLHNEIAWDPSRFCPVAHHPLAPLPPP